MRFTFSAEPTAAYRNYIDPNGWCGERRTTADPTKANKAFEQVCDDLLEAGYTIVTREAYGRQCRRVMAYDYELCTAPAFIITITA